METTRLSSKGQLIIPKPIRASHHWETGQVLEVLTLEEGVLLRPHNPFKETKMEDVEGCLPYSDSPKSLEDMEDAIRKGVTERMSDID